MSSELRGARPPCTSRRNRGSCRCALNFTPPPSPLPRILLIVGVASLKHLNTDCSAQVVRWLAEGDPSRLSREDARGKYPIHFAARFDRLEVVRWMFETDPAVRAGAHRGGGGGEPPSWCHLMVGHCVFECAGVARGSRLRSWWRRCSARAAGGA
jgi:hypothetical protein